MDAPWSAKGGGTRGTVIRRITGGLLCRDTAKSLTRWRERYAGISESQSLNPAECWQSKGVFMVRECLEVFLIVIEAFLGLFLALAGFNGIWTNLTASRIP